MTKRIPLSRWLVDAMTDTDKDGPIIAIQLVHCTGTEFSKQTEIHAVRFGNKVWKEDELAELFQNKAQHYCQDLPGNHLFCLLAYYGKAIPGEQAKLNEPEARHFFRVQGDTANGGVITEPATEAGMKGQLMRSFDINSQLAWKAQMASVEQLLRVNEHYVESNVRLMMANERKNEMLEKIFAQQMQTNHEMRLKELEAERNNALVNKGLNLLPGLVESLTGSKILPDNTVSESLLEQVAAELTIEKLAALQQLFSPELVALLATKLQKIREEQEKNNKKLRLVDEK